MDLSLAHLIDVAFTVASTTSPASAISAGTGPPLNAYFPACKLGQSNYFYVYSGGGINYFGLSAMTYVDTASVNSSPALTVAQAYNIDKKVDDGLPQAGTVTAQYLNHSLPGPYPAWVNGNGWLGASPGAVAAAASTSCYDNGGNASAVMAYSMTQNNGAGMNCALSFKFQ